MFSERFSATRSCQCHHGTPECCCCSACTFVATHVHNHSLDSLAPEKQINNASFLNGEHTNHFQIADKRSQNDILAEAGRSSSKLLPATRSKLQNSSTVHVDRMITDDQPGIENPALNSSNIQFDPNVLNSGTVRSNLVGGVRLRNVDQTKPSGSQVMETASRHFSPHNQHSNSFLLNSSAFQPNQLTSTKRTRGSDADANLFSTVFNRSSPRSAQYQDRRPQSPDFEHLESLKAPSTSQFKLQGGKSPVSPPSVTQPVPRVISPQFQSYGVKSEGKPPVENHEAQTSLNDQSFSRQFVNQGSQVSLDPQLTNQRMQSAASQQFENHRGQSSFRPQ